MPDSYSIYSLNKRDSDAIVYTNANGTVTRLTRADFDTEQEFQRWKEWSDNDFHAEEKQDHIFEDNNYSLEAQPEHIAKVPSAEAVLERESSNRARERYTEEAINKIRSKITDKQFRRLWLYYVEGMTAEEIGFLEHRTHQAISKSIRSAKKKM